jgi:hypothetical protein
MSNKIILAVAVVIFSVSACCIDHHFPVKGNGKLVTSEKSVSTFEKIQSSGEVNVRFHASEEYFTVLTIDSNLEKYVEIYTKNGVLHIKTEKGHSFSFTKFQVDVYCPVLSGVSMSGSGSFEGMDIIIASTFNATISGSGEVNGTFECESFSAKISGSGKMTVTGSSNDVNIGISGSGDYRGGDFQTKNATVSISGSGNVNVWVTDYLKVNISGSGKLNYRGEPEINSSVTGSGWIRKM